MVEIKLQDGAIVNGNGKTRVKTAKPIMCKETFQVWASMSDFAEEHNIGEPSVSHAIRMKGKCKGHSLCLLSDVKENLDEILKNGRLMRDKAAAYDAIIAEQEAKRKAEAERIEKLRKANENLERYKADMEKLTKLITETEAEINQLEF